MKFKYPSTPHLPFSESVQDDDFIVGAEGLINFRSGEELIVTEKMDGGNVSLYRDDFHARSIDSKSLPWEQRSKAVWGSIRHLIPEGVRISAESLEARRSVGYDDLPSPLLVFGVWRGTELLSWGETEEFAATLGLSLVPVLYRGTSFVEASEAWSKIRNAATSEGFVLRTAGRIALEDFASHVAKYVRANHVRTSDDWRHRDDFERNSFAL